MGRSEDYLDSLLDSLNEPNESKATELSEVSKAPKKRTPDTEASYLDAFEKELGLDLGEDTSAFLREFESDLGLEPSDSLASKESLGSLTPLSSISSLDDVINSADDNVLDEVSASSDIDVSDILNNIDIEDTEPLGSNPKLQSNSADLASDSGDVSYDSNASESQPQEEEEDFISDIDDENEASSVPSFEPVESGEVPGASEVPDDSSNDDSDNVSESSKDDISQDEILDIGDLLDSIDEEGNLSESEIETKPGDAIDEESSEDGAASDGDGASKSNDKKGEESEEDKEGKKKKPGFLSKLIAILFSTGEEKEGEEGEEGKEEAPAQPIDEEPPIDKKQAKKEEKERKKKEKEEAKKKAKEEKDKKAKEKPPKAPKQKKPKVPDKSPKIPLIAILAFLLLSISMVVLWFVAQKTISHALFINSAKSSFDHQEYVASYQKLSGIENLNEDELMLYNRAKIMAMLEYRIKGYEYYTEREEQINAIDALVRGSVYYNNHKREASEMGIPSEYEELGRYINDKLSTIYGLSEQDAKDLMALRERKTYTRELYRILEREGLWSYEKR